MTLLNRFHDNDAPINWKTNLAALWAAQFIIMSAFFFCLPFVPLYLRESGIVPPEDVQFWAGVFLAAAPGALMFMAPVWGMLGDRYGRKPLLVRATVVSAFVLYVMGMVGNIYIIIALRLLQGGFSGTLPVAQAIVTTTTPEKRQGFAIGVLMSSVAAGTAAGAFFGGICAKNFGAVSTFKIGGVVMLVATFLGVFVVREKFTKPAPEPDQSPTARKARRRESVRGFKIILPMLACIGYVCFFQVYDTPLLALYIDELYRLVPGLAGSMTPEETTGAVMLTTGYLSASATVVAVLGSTIGGMILDRRAPFWIWVALSAFGAAGAYYVSREQSLFGLAVGRSAYLFVISGFASVVVVILSRMTESRTRSAALGWAYTARSLGWTLAPLLSSHWARSRGFAHAYFMLAVLVLLCAPMFVFMDRRYPKALRPDEPPPDNADGDEAAARSAGVLTGEDAV